ncbi:uncharacterized protein LOC125488548 isoform X2 [Plutella xylostella]|uniref:uncharacterized protein LOC125488548 isoform X2 n=1 Tax=Plutella xylostella TaxID=51655 RepID=UPI002032EB0D|nr:uncharacterized protein LOC125488548 isoform X2 [Plutella xylostella]
MLKVMEINLYRVRLVVLLQIRSVGDETRKLDHSRDMGCSTTTDELKMDKDEPAVRLCLRCGCACGAAVPAVRLCLRCGCACGAAVPTVRLSLRCGCAWGAAVSAVRLSLRCGCAWGAAVPGVRLCLGCGWGCACGCGGAAGVASVYISGYRPGVGAVVMAAVRAVNININRTKAGGTVEEMAISGVSTQTEDTIPYQTEAGV